MDEMKVLIKFVRDLRERLPGAGISKFKMTDDRIQVRIEKAGRQRCLPNEMEECKAVATKFSENGTLLEIMTDSATKGPGWQTYDDFRVCAWSKDREYAEYLKSELESTWNTYNPITVQELSHLASCYRGMKQPALAERCLIEMEKLLDLNDPDIDDEDRGANYWAIASEYLELDRFDLARRANDKARKHNYGEREVEFLAEEIQAREEWLTNEHRQLEDIFAKGSKRVAASKP